MEGKLEMAKKKAGEEETYSDDDDGWEDSDGEMESRVDSLESNIGMSRAPIPKFERRLMTVSQIGRSLEDMRFKKAYFKAHFSNILGNVTETTKMKEKEKEKEKETSPSSSKIRKRSAWADPLNMQNQMVRSRPDQESQIQYLVLTSSLKCDDCANIISQGSRLYCTDLTHPLCVESYPIKQYLNCPNCSVEIVMEIVEGESGFKSLVGATEYSGPVDKRNIVIESAKWDWIRVSDKGWADQLPPPSLLPVTQLLRMSPPVVPQQRRLPRPGSLELKASVQCDACAHIIARGSIIHCRHIGHAFYKGCPIKHYVKCPNCSVQMTIGIVEGESGFGSLFCATEYFGPVNEEN